jgi:hypothetical protein
MQTYLAAQHNVPVYRIQVVGMGNNEQKTVAGKSRYLGIKEKQTSSRMAERVGGGARSRKALGVYAALPFETQGRSRGTKTNN